MNIARLIFHTVITIFYRVLINRIRHVSARLNEPVAIFAGLQGPKIRCGKMLNDAVVL